MTLFVLMKAVLMPSCESKLFLVYGGFNRSAYRIVIHNEFSGKEELGLFPPSSSPGLNKHRRLTEGIL